MTKKKEPARVASRRGPRERPLTANDVIAWASQLAEAKTEKEREKIRTRIKRFIGQH
jgi:hypothetical protein